MSKRARGRNALADVDLPASGSRRQGPVSVPGGGSLSRGRLDVGAPYRWSAPACQPGRALPPISKV